jgi:hypothetical protein
VLWNGGEKFGKALTVRNETVTLIGEGRYNLMGLWCVKCMKLIVTYTYFYFSDILFLGVILDLNKYIFPWQMCFFFVRSS